MRCPPRSPEKASACHTAAVDHQIASGDVARHIAGEEKSRARHVVGCAKPRPRCPAARIVERIGIVGNAGLSGDDLVSVIKSFGTFSGEIEWRIWRIL